MSKLKNAFGIVGKTGIKRARFEAKIRYGQGDTQSHYLNAKKVIENAYPDVEVIEDFISEEDLKGDIKPFEILINDELAHSRVNGDKNINSLNGFKLVQKIESMIR